MIREQIQNYSSQMTASDVGTVIQTSDGIARIYGLEKAMQGELLLFPGDVAGMAMNLEEDSIGAVLFGDFQDIKEGDLVRSTGRIVEVPAGDDMLGRVVNALGQPIDGKGEIQTVCRRPVQRSAPGVLSRKSIEEPLQTGIKAIDAMVPVGKKGKES